MCKRILLPLGLGFVFGVLMALPMVIAVPILEKPYAIINAPAFRLANTWTDDFGLPPRGQISLLALPMAAVVVQWTLTGLLIGLCRCFKLRSTRPASLGEKNES
jgi:hypothetical protein